MDSISSISLKSFGSGLFYLSLTQGVKTLGVVATSCLILHFVTHANVCIQNGALILLRER